MEASPIDIQRVRVKVFADAPDEVDVQPLIGIFARWRNDAEHPARWIDLADYAHVPDGPAALLVGKQGNLGYDLEDGRPGLIWRNKIALDGDAETRVAVALSRGLALFRDLAAESEFPEAIRLDPGRLAIEFVDRVEVPNDETTQAALAPAIGAVLDRLYGEGEWKAERRDDAGRPVTFEARAAVSGPVDLGHLGALDALIDRLGTEAELATAPKEQGMELKRVSATESAELIEKEGYVYVDVRSIGEFDAGHPTGAYNIPILIEGSVGHALVPNRDFLAVMEATFERDAKLIVGCRSGGRSLRAAQILKANGFTDVIDNFAGFEAGQGPRGVELGWGRSDLPVSQEPEDGKSWAELRVGAEG